MSILEVPGARLYYETHGSGPLMIVVPGANGEADIFKMVTQHLASHYTVVAYDRRGFSRSKLDGPQDYDRRLETDADDVRRLIEHLSDEPAIIFGGSSGAIVALEVLTYHPSVVRTLLPFEPPAVRQLPDGQKWVNFFFEIYDLYRQSGVEPALKKFREQTFAKSDRQVMARARDRNNGEYGLANATYWFEYELRQYPAIELDLDALEAHADRIVPLAGRESRGYPCYEVSVSLAKRLGREVIELPGGHVGPLSQPAEFARELLDTHRSKAEPNPTEQEGVSMTAPFIVVNTYAIKEGKLEGFRQFLQDLLKVLEANEPRLLAINAYLNEEGTEAVIVQVHPDAASIKHYWQVVHQHTGQALGQFVDATTNLQLYGAPSNVTMKRARQSAESGVAVSVKPDYLGGFTRSWRRADPAAR